VIETRRAFEFAQQILDDLPNAKACVPGRLYFGDFEPVAGLQEVQPADDGQGGVSGILFGSSDLGIGEDISPVERDAKAELSAGAVNHVFLGACGGEVQPR
jgi:hypothetical protein